MVVKVVTVVVRERFWPWRVVLVVVVSIIFIMRPLKNSS